MTSRAQPVRLLLNSPALIRKRQSLRALFARALNTKIMEPATDYSGWTSEELIARVRALEARLGGLEKAMAK